MMCLVAPPKIVCRNHGLRPRPEIAPYHIAQAERCLCVTILGHHVGEGGQKQKSQSAKGTSGLPSEADIIAEAKEVPFGP